MTSPLASLVATGTRLWLDSVDPELIAVNRRLGATGATSNPILISDLIRTGRFDRRLQQLLAEGHADEHVAWSLTDELVRAAQEVFLPVWQATDGDDGYVSFELDPLLEDAASPLSPAEKTERYVELGRRWSHGHANRLIKVPATAGGLGALESLAAHGVPLNVTLLFTVAQYRQAREAVWRGAAQLPHRDRFKCVFSIFVSRLDAYTRQHVPGLSPAAQGQAGLLNAKRIWRDNQEFWAARPTHLRQEIVFASTGVKDAAEPAWKYVEALAGSDIQTNPPATNDAVEQSGLTFRRNIDELPAEEVVREIAEKVDAELLERVLMAEGLAKFAEPQHRLLALIGERRQALIAGAGTTSERGGRPPQRGAN
jgi:transaldolase